MDNFYNLSAEEVEQHLKTDANSGLSEDEAGERIKEHGYNEFRKHKHKSLISKFLGQFKSFMIIVLLVAAAISGVIGYLEGEGFTDAIIILVIVILNAIIGTAQESKAEKSLEALEKLSMPHCKVVRGGQVRIIESRELVPGDVVILETGDTVPADIRLTETVNLKVQESAMTGESVPEDKFTEAIEGEVGLGDRDNMAFASSSITYGRGRGIVTATGMNSEMGKIASMIQSVPDTKTPMQERLDKLGKILAIVAISICVLIFVVGMLYGRNLVEMFMTAVSLAAAAIPEGLPAVSTIVLAVGVQRLVKKNAIVRKLPSVETLGSTQVICSDKTGTLTQNKMTVVKMYLNNTITEVSKLTNDTIVHYHALIESAILANDAILSEKEGNWVTNGDPTETAMLDLGLKFEIKKNILDNDTPRVAEIPFDSERKMMTTVNCDANGNLRVHTKGGLDEVLSACTHILMNGEVQPLTDVMKKKIEEDNMQMAKEALRVLAVARKEIVTLPETIAPASLEKELTFIGMLGLIDPPREEVKEAVEKCLEAGIKPVMITGDHK